MNETCERKDNISAEPDSCLEEEEEMTERIIDSTEQPTDESELLSQLNTNP